MLGSRYVIYKDNNYNIKLNYHHSTNQQTTITPPTVKLPYHSTPKIKQPLHNL